MTPRILAIPLVAVLLVPAAPRATAHCQVPCGIYGDEARFAMIEENLVTIEKAMAQIRGLAGNPADANQLVRWVNTKEAHANDIMEIVAHYFLAQRIKAPATDDPKAAAEYSGKLETLHRMLTTAMKCKQTTDAANVETLRELLATFHLQYFGKPAEPHDHGHEEYEPHSH
jgi:hypothetical protein